MIWTEEKKKRLRELWDDAGWTAKQIAADLGDGCTKNAVIGQAHRLKLGERPSPIIKKVEETPKKEDTAMVGPEYIGELFVPLLPKADRRHKGQGVGLIELRERSCRFPLGDPQDKDFGFCGDKTAVDKVYCKHHLKVCYSPNSQYRRGKS